MAVLGSLFVLLIARLGHVQLVEGPPAPRAPAALMTRTLTEAAARGTILDRRGRPLVANRYTTTVTVPRSVLLDAPDGGRGLVAAVAGVLQRPFEDLWGKTMLCGTAGAPPAPACFNGSPYVPIPLATEVDAQQALSLLERPETFAGIGVVSEPSRDHPMAPRVSAAHLLGYVGRPSADEVTASAGRVGDEDLVGRSGLEAEYDQVLRGTNGRTVVSIDPRGAVTDTLSSVPPTPGLDLLTHIDADVQAAAERALSRAVSRARADGHPADSGAAVVIDVTNGAVVGAASHPTYDPGIFTGGITAAELRRLTDEKAGAALRSRIIAETYPPASTFKVISVPAAVSAGASLKGKYECSPSYRIGDHVFHNYESRGYGRIDLHRALVVSCDTVFYRLAHQAWIDQGGISAPVGRVDPFVAMARSFGLGGSTGVDLPGEATGTIPDRAWKREYWEASRQETCARARTGYPQLARTDKERAAYLTRLAKENCASGFQYRAGDAVNLSIGQGDLAVTPLQMAVVFAAIANGGTLWQPQVAAGFRSGTGAVTQIPAHHVGTVPVAGGVLAYVRRALADVTRPGGSAGSAFAGFPQDRFPVAGKTGTGEVFGHAATAWFAGYGPTTRPRYAVVVVVGQGGSGSQVAAPAVREIFDVLRVER
ncbi:MAG TPA: penicillin-binding transpeptidase domain-containing protein [Intrasporangium sp.]|uniref:penicillin-binding transpeptidase domain-containing protein n=1 Tax=Intrasporangium sp. TaxID=1925024 RepID=UPI002B4909EE|nr:penicillin-binding transpeptidase domain-containing protein [Intrasporangium sp.]HKX68096.1 penicillin-binding transpeptidase domain-containing protein [Intrasporangium sp.]